MNVGKRWIGFLICNIIFLSCFSYAQVLINEVMYDPGQCSDNYCEWAELYNSDNETVDLSGCYFDGDELSGNISGHDYLVLVRNNDYFKHYFGAGKNILKISLNLVNKGKEIILNGTNCSDNFDYTNFVDLAKGNNKTLEMSKKGKWKESIGVGGTPGEKNSVIGFGYDYSKLEIVEVMVDPFGKDESNKPLGEWIEIYNSGQDPIYLGGLVIYDSEDDHELYFDQTNVDSLSLCAGCYEVVYRNGDGDFSLSKTTDKVRLFTGYPVKKSVLIDEVGFSNSVEGMSWSKINSQWYKTKPTPSKENVYTGGCDWALDLEMNNSIFQNGDLSFQVAVKRNYGEAENISVTGKVEDIFGNSVKNYKPWTNQRVVSSASKSYSPNLKERTYQLSFELEGLVCQDDDLSNNKVLKLIAINPKYKKTESTLGIEKLYLGSDNSAEWGDQFNVKVNIYKGDESKSAVEMYVVKSEEVVSKRTKINLYDKYKNYVVTLPVQLIPNCHEKIDDGKFKLVLKGLDLEVKKEFLIEGVDKDVCKDYLNYVKEVAKLEAKKKKKYDVIGLPGIVYMGDVFRVKVQLIGDAQEHDFKMWSYLYKGSKCISCSTGNRKSNLIDFRLKKDEVKQVEMLVKVDKDVSVGEHKLKVKLNKDGQKGNKELVKSVYVKKREVKTVNQSTGFLSRVGETSEITGGAVSTKINPRKEKIIHEIPGIVVYESSSEKAKNLVPYLLVGVFGLLCVILGWKKL